MRFPLHPFDLSHLHIRQQLVIPPHHLVGNAITLPYISKGGSWIPIAFSKDFDIFFTPAPLQNRRRQHHLRLLPVGALQFAAYEQIKFLVSAAEFHIRFERNRVIFLHQWIEQLVQAMGFSSRNRL